jgi:FMN phosphatase YigB (HAD superfamily)
MVLIIDLDGVVRDWDPAVASAAEQRAFWAVLRALGCCAADCLFVDDTAGHVLAAAGLGLQGHHFRPAPGPAAFLSAPMVHPHPRG